MYRSFKNKKIVINLTNLNKTEKLPDKPIFKHMKHESKLLTKNRNKLMNEKEKKQVAKYT